VIEEGVSKTMHHINTLIYKRTHKGDPDKSGIFGVNDCMGKIRHWNFDAVIGIGGKCPDKEHENIALKINWIGINSKKMEAGKRGPLVAFKHFCLYEEEGPYLKTLAPKIFKYMFEDKNIRAVTSYSLPADMQEEISRILKLAERCHKSDGFHVGPQPHGKCS
jgi:hypothetical protein